jgi:HEAT repeat protein
MSERFVSTVAAILAELQRQPRDAETLGLFARGLRWQRSIDAEDLVALEGLLELIRRKQGPGCWEVERAVLEIFCDRAGAEHIQLLINIFRQNAERHGNDRRRLSLQALSGVAARTGDADALRVLEEGLSHAKKDTRGWAIGYLVGSYASLGHPLPQSALDRLRFLMNHDSSPDVRVEALTALAELGLVDPATVAAVVAAAGEQPHSKKSRKRLRISHE